MIKLLKLKQAEWDQITNRREHKERQGMVNGMIGYPNTINRFFSKENKDSKEHKKLEQYYLLETKSPWRRSHCSVANQSRKAKDQRYFRKFGQLKIKVPEQVPLLFRINVRTFKGCHNLYCSSTCNCSMWYLGCWVHQAEDDFKGS